MARGHGSPTSVSLPKVSFEEIRDDVSTQPGGVHDLQARSYGYNDFSEFRRPDHYIRHIEPLESDLARQVEYDMDEQDQEWLDALNAERKKDQLNKVTYEVFEIVMDRLEKEWFDLTKNIPKPDLAMPSEDSTCAICDDSEGENSNAIVFCDGCNLAVHQDCYGVPYIPEGQWLCRKCTVSPENPVSCILCPNEGGAFKQTVTGEWVHLLCAIWVPETRVANDVFMEPVTGIEKISKQRWKLRCNVCEIREGACIQCAKTSCFLAFHATCARKERLLLPMKSTQGSEPVTLTCYCERHLPQEQQDARAAALATEEQADAEDNTSECNTRLSKTARAYAKTYKPGPPLVPALIVNRILHYINKVMIRKKSEFVLSVCRYWSLKREARRGAPLLKRLHLEPWTASTGGKVQSEAEKIMKLELLQHLRRDLESVRAIVELSRKRETRKLWQAEVIRNILSQFLFPHESRLRSVFERIAALDRNDYFKNPVSKLAVPDYFDIVEFPMCWNIIEAKLDRYEYWDVQNLKDDISLVISNAMLYNKPGTPFFKAATRIRTASQSILNELDSLSLPPPDPIVDGGTVAEWRSTTGDLEPPIEVLDLLLTTDAIKADLPIILNQEPILSLFDYELAQAKPPPPPSPVAPRKPAKPKRDRKAELELKNVVTEMDGGIGKTPAEVQAALDFSPGFRAPRTRGAMAAVISSSNSNPGSGKRGKKRAPGALPSRSVVPPMVDDIDNQKSFMMFERGWIFPPDHRRGGRAPVDRQPVAPPKKRQKTDAGTSRLSVLSTAASENQTHQDTIPVDHTEPGPSVPQVLAPTPSEQPTTSAPNQLPLPDKDDSTSRNNIIHSATGTIIIEELDTPAIRRAKNIRKKNEKRLAASAILAPAPLEAGPSLPPPTPVQIPAPMDMVDYELDSDLSSLSDVGSEDMVVRPKPKPPRVVAVPLAGAPEPGAVILPAGTMLEGGTLDSFPWWPAVIFEDDDPSVPRNILNHCIDARQKRGAVIHILQFFDKTSSWQFLPLDKLLLLGEDKSLDDELLAVNSRKQKWKTTAVRHECTSAYKSAMAEMETGSDLEGVEIENKDVNNNETAATEVQDV
ncbi:PHD-zinc-finger like domain-containing protein [Infundibulicybe gibba]|nr:PHD-zinc-finger like domain-containing protein [Infundibulicybe gibba]